MLKLSSTAARVAVRFTPPRGETARIRSVSRASLAALLLAGALLVALFAGGAHAETTVTVEPAEVASALFVAGDVSRLSEVRYGTEELVLEKALQQMYADEPTLAPATAEGYVAEMKALLTSSSAPSQASLQLMAGNQRIIAILAALERGGTLPAPARLAVTHLADAALSGSSDIFDDAESPKYFEPLADERTNLTYTSFAPATVLRGTHALAEGNKPFGEARDALWEGASEESVFSGWKELLEESNVLQTPALQELREAVELGKGTLAETPEQITAMFTQGQQTTQEQACEHSGASEPEIGGSSIPNVPRLKCSGGALYEAAHLPKACPEKEKCEKEFEKIETNAEKQQRIIAEERSAMIAAAELLRPSDNTAATLQQATAEAQGKITEEETAYAEYEAEKAERELIAGSVNSAAQGIGIGVAFATDNFSEGISGLIGVAFELYERTEGELENPPPGPQEITLEDLADLSAQLSGFQQYTQEAFKALNTQVAQLSSQLARENYELKEEIGDLGARLEKEQGTIFALQDEVQTLFAAQTKANLQGTIEDSVGWLKLTGEPLSGEKFQESLVALKKYATEIANGSLVNNSETQPYTYEGANRQLTDKVTGEPAELSEDISYLGRFPLEQGWLTSTQPATLPNTTFWAESARAYAQLMLENSTHTTAADIAGLKGLEKEALTLETAEGAWSSDNAGAPTDNAVLDKALAHLEAAAYGAGVDGAPSITTVLEEAAEKTLEQSLKADAKTPSPLANPTSVKLWGGPEQSFSASSVYSAQYPALKWSECAGSAEKNGEQEMPESFIASLPSSLVAGVRLGVIGATGSGDRLILNACRTITKTNSVVSTKTAEHREYCPGFKTAGCEIVYEAEAKLEHEAEAVKETLTLTEGGGTLTSASVGECNQTSLYWSGAAHDESEDGELKSDKGGIYGRTNIGKPFEERHVGVIESLYYSGNELGWTYYTSPIEGAPCPFEGTEEKAGIEYANYSTGEKALASAEPTIVQDIEAKLREIQEDAYSEGLKSLKSPSVGDPVESLAGARALVQSYVKLGFPQALASNPTLQSDIEGVGAQFLSPTPGAPEPVAEELTNLIGSWLHKLQGASGSELTQLLRDELLEEVKERSSKWASEVAEAVKPFVEGKVEGFEGESTEAVSEQPALVESTLNRLQLTRDVLDEARAPSAETLTPDSDVGIEEATVRGEVDPDGGVVESCVFEYGATAYYGHTVECSAIPAGTEKAVIVSATIANWTPEGSFHERVVLKTWGGTSYGEDMKVELAQSTQAPAGLVVARTATPEASIDGFTAEELPPGVELPAGAKQLVGSLSFTVNVIPGGTARVNIELPEGSAPNALYKLVTGSGGAKEYKEIPTSLYTIKGSMIELTLVDGGPDDEDGVANGVIVDPLVPVVATPQSPPPAEESKTTPNPPSNGGGGQHAENVGPPSATIGSPAGDGLYTVGSVVQTKFACEEAAGGPGLASCVDSAGASNGVGKLDTSKVGVYTYTVTATSRDGQHSTASIAYAVAARHECVSGNTVTLHVGYHVQLPEGTSLQSSKVLERGRVVAKLRGVEEVRVLHFTGKQKRPYQVTLVSKLSNGKTRTTHVVFHSCIGVPKPASSKR
jgi:hypothetical protein